MYTFIDFETTGFDPNEEQVIEVAAVKVDANLNVKGTLHLMVALKNGKELPDIIVELTGIKEEDLVGGFDEKQSLEILAQFIGNSTVVAQFASFDLGFLAKQLEPTSFICTRSMAQLLRPNEKSSLKNLVERYGVALDNHHRALDDVTATIEVFKHLRKECEDIEYVNIMTETSERPLRYVPSIAKVVKL